jgi:hypothetical protein
MIIHNPILTGSFTVNGTDVASITSSAASLTSLNDYTASQNNRNGTYATTGSNTFAGIQTVNSNLVVTGSITAQTLVVQTITSSVDFVTGSTRFGSLLTNTHVFSGSVSMNPGGLFVSGSGRVGINTTNPLSLFDITVLTGGARRLLVNYDDSLVTIKSANDSATGESLRVWGDNIYFYTGSAGSELMRLTNTGRVGIGTTTPDGKLHVFGKTYARYGQDDMFAFYYDDTYRFGITNPSTDLRQLRVFGQAADGNSFIVFATNNNIERMRITTDGAMYMSRVNSNLTFADSVGGMYVRQDGSISGTQEELRIFGRNIAFYSHSGTRYASITSTGQFIANYGQTGGYNRTDSGYVNETINITANCTAYFLYKYSGGGNGSSSTNFNITGVSTTNGTWLDVCIRARKDATGNAINTTAVFQINGSTIDSIAASGTGAQQRDKTLRVVRMSDEWIVVGTPYTV